MQLSAYSDLSLPLPAAAGSPPEWVHLLPEGETLARDGRRFRADAAGVARRTLERLGETQLAIDYNHQSERAASNGQPAPAAGWIEELAARADGLWGRVRWTERAAEALRQREFRYLSPSLMHDPAGEVLWLFGAALTNRPALELTALAQAERNTTEDGDQPMKLPPELIAALGIAAEAATLEAAVARVKELTAASDRERAHARALCESLGIESEDPAHQLAAARAIAAASARAADAGADPNPERYVPRSEFERVSKDLSELRAAQATAEAERAVDGAIKAGKVIPANREWAMGYARENPEGFAAYCEATPAILEPGESSLARGRPPGAGGGDSLAGVERAVCEQMGIDPKAFLAARKRLAGEPATTEEETA